MLPWLRVTHLLKPPDNSFVWILRLVASCSVCLAPGPSATLAVSADVFPSAIPMFRIFVVCSDLVGILVSRFFSTGLAFLLLSAFSRSGKLVLL